MKAFRSLFLLSALLLAACVNVPDGIQPVQNFDAERYLGTWYEIARLDHRFERGLVDVSATYARRDDGGISVLNRGYRVDDEAWDEARGKAYFVRDASTGFLKVSFFGPFYGAYVIFDLDEDYQYSFVSGPNRDYLWLLSRTPTVPPSVLERFRAHAAEVGFDTEALIVVDQSRSINALEDR
ncbi:MAG: lipocalin family protein [Pseudomonadota bacterium]